MTDHRSPKEIERDLEEQREGLADSLDDLKEKFSVDTLVREAANQLRTHSGDIGASVTRAVKENPLGVALTGVGLAWLIFGERRSPETDIERRAVRRTRDTFRDDHDPYGAYAARNAPRQAGNPQPSMRDTDMPSWARGVDDRQDNDTSGGRLDGMKAAMHDSADAMRDRAAALRDRLSEGTEHFSEEGRARVLAARERAYKAREATMSRMSEARDKAVDLFEEQPLIAGGLALAVGAAIGAALPHTRFEDEHFGDTAHDLMHEAERIYAEERDKLGKIAQQAAQDVGEVVEKAASDAIDTLDAGQGGQSDDLPGAAPRTTRTGDIPS